MNTKYYRNDLKVVLKAEPHGISGIYHVLMYRISPDQIKYMECYWNNYLDANTIRKLLRYIKDNNLAKKC